MRAIIHHEGRLGRTATSHTYNVRVAYVMYLDCTVFLSNSHQFILKPSVAVAGKTNRNSQSRISGNEPLLNSRLEFHEFQRFLNLYFFHPKLRSFIAFLQCYIKIQLTVIQDNFKRHLVKVLVGLIFALSARIIVELAFAKYTCNCVADMNVPECQ